MGDITFKTPQLSKQAPVHINVIGIADKGMRKEI